jgi:aspartate carbamoyltransferase catalytic subunit
LALPAVTIDHDLDRAIEGADVVMALRLQHERMRSAYFPSLREYSQRYQITAERLRRAADGAIVMHPGPMNEGVEIAPEVAHGLYSQVEQQVRHGVAVRMAVLYLLARNAA